MDGNGTRPSHSQGQKEKWTSTLASSPRNNTLPVGAQPQAQDCLQPLGYFYEGERTTSPPPVALEKAMDPSPGSRPGTPTASSTSCLSRSSTLNSSSTAQTEDSDITSYSQSSTSSDNTVSVSRSLTFPAMGSYPVDRKSLPKGASIHVFELPRSLFEQHGWRWPGRDRHNEGGPARNTQAPPSRHLTFPIERSRNPSKLDGTHSFVCGADEDFIAPESSSTRDTLPKDVTATSGTDMSYSVFRQEMPPDEVGLRSLQSQSDMSLGSLDSKHAEMYGGLAPYPPTESLPQPRKEHSREYPIIQIHKGSERAIYVGHRCFRVDRVQSWSRDCTVFSSAGTVVASGAAVGPEEPSRIDPRKQADDNQISRPSSPIAESQPPFERDRELSSSDSDDNANLAHDDTGSETEEEEEFAYDQLVQSITNLVLESSCVGNVEERGIPVGLYVHNFLEQVLNHSKPATGSQEQSLPIRSLAMPANEEPVDAGEPSMSARGRGGDTSSTGANKRKNDEAPRQNRGCDYGGEEDNHGHSSEQEQGTSPQRAKKLKTGRDGRSFSCPFRKRNPTLFNVRDHGSCALHGFADFALLKRHIKNSHQKAKLSSCVRCKETFADQAALTYHLTRPESCSLRDVSGDEHPEDGITEEIDRALKDRARGNNIRSWESLWGLLFPRDAPESIPDPYHEPPVELDELQNQYYDEAAFRKFVHEQHTMDGQEGITDHGFNYMVEGMWHCRKTHLHERSKNRLERDARFRDMVRGALSTRQQRGAQGQQGQPGPPGGTTPGQWPPGGDAFDDALSLDIDFDLYASEVPYPGFPAYASHLGGSGPSPSSSSSSQGPGGAPAPGGGGRSSGDPARACRAYGAMPSQGSSGPCSPAGAGSAHDRPSGPSSQSQSHSRSRDSGDGQTQATQDTQYTQYAQEQEDAAALLYCYSGAVVGGGGDGGGPFCGQGDGAFLSPMAPGGGGGGHVPGQGSSDLYGVGTSSFARAECPDGSNSDEDLGPLPYIR